MLLLSHKTICKSSSIFLDEWKNFLERLGYEDMEKLKDDGKEEELRNWASFRGQTLSRTGNKILTIVY